MNDNSHPQNDPRSIEELVNIAIGEPDEDVVWNAINALHWRGSRDVLTIAQNLSGRPCPQERKLGCDILGQIGVPERTFPEECMSTLLHTLQEENDPTVLHTIFVSFGHLDDERIISAAARFKKHPDVEVRYAIAFALGGHEKEQAIALILELMNDTEPKVRDWATFGLGSQTEADSPAIRDALAARLADVDADTRGEALVGLANRGDDRALATINESELPFAQTDTSKMLSTF